MRNNLLLYLLLISVIMPTKILALEIKKENKVKSEGPKPESKLKPIPDNTFKSLDELSEDVPVSLPKDI